MNLLILNFISIFMGLRPHFGRFLASKPRFWLAKTLPKSTQNAFKIEVPKNMQFFSPCLAIFSCICIFDFLKICILPKKIHYFQGFRSKHAFTISVYFSFKKSFKNQSKIESQRLKNQCQKRAFF